MTSAISTTAEQDTLRRASIDRSLRLPVMFFLISGSAWLIFAIVLGAVASAKVHSPGFLTDFGWLTYGRVFPAHLNALVYGWGMQVAFAMMLWLMARMTRLECTSAVRILTAGHVWNIGVALGVLGILSGNGSGMPWMEFPGFAWPVLLVSYCVIVVGSFIQFRVREAGQVFIAQWYILAAMIWFPWVFITANCLLRCMPGHPVMAAGINSWYQSALVFLFFVPVAVGTACYLAPKTTGQPLAGEALAKLGFWSLAIIAPWAGMQKMSGMPLPYFLPYVGAAATALLFIPLVAAATNTLRTIRAGGESMSASPALRFTVAGMVGMLLLALALVVLNLPDSTLPLTQFSLSGYGFNMLALYGVFSMVMFGGIYFIVPRVTCSEWLSRRMIMVHYLFSVYGMGTIILVALFGGIQQGLDQEAWQSPWLQAAASPLPFAVANTFAWCLILLANASFFVHLFLMWLRLGRQDAMPVQLVVVPVSHSHDEPAVAVSAPTSPDRLASL